MSYKRLPEMGWMMDCDPSLTYVLSDARLYAALALALDMADGISRVSYLEDFSDVEMILGVDRIGVLSHRRKMARDTLKIEGICEALGGRWTTLGDAPGAMRDMIGASGTGVVIRNGSNPKSRLRYTSADDHFQQHASAVFGSEDLGHPDTPVFLQPFDDIQWPMRHFIIKGRVVASTADTFEAATMIGSPGSELLLAPSHFSPLEKAANARLRDDQLALAQQIAEQNPDLAHISVETGIGKKSQKAAPVSIFMTDPGEDQVLFADAQAYALAVASEINAIFEQQASYRANVVGHDTFGMSI